MNGLDVAAVVVLGTLVGLDVASVPQAMFSRPLVAGLLGGVVVGAPLPGLTIGAILELFAMDALPVGAARTPDWGPGTVAVGAVAGSHPSGIMASGLLGLVVVAVVSAWVGGLLTHQVRRANVDSVVRYRTALEAGDVRALLTIQRQGLLRDATRSFALASIALALGDVAASLLARRWGGSQDLALIVLAASSIGVVLHAGWRRAGPGLQGLWLLGGVGAGALVTVWLT